MDVDDDGDSEASMSKAVPAGDKKKKSATEMYTKVKSLFSMFAGSLNTSIVITIGTHLETSGFVHWQCGNHYSDYVDLRRGNQANGPS